VGRTGPVLSLALCAACALFAACARSPRGDHAPPRVSATVGSLATPADAAPPAVADAAVFRGPHATDAPMSWAFWTRGGALVSASRTDLWKLDPACAPPQRVPVPIDDVIAEGGADAFVIEHAGVFTLWDAATMHAVGAIDHPARGRGGAVSRKGAHVALGGCREIADDPKLVTSCGEIYDTVTGRHTASFVGKHDFGELAFSEDGKYLVARGEDHGLTVFDAATGKVRVTRSRWSHMREVHGWNRPDVEQIAGDELVVSYDDTVEHVDLVTGKTLGKLVTPGATLAVFGEKTKRVAVLEGEAARARVWDVPRHAVVRTFALAKYVAAGANCRHCAIEIDEVDEDRMWLTSTYTDDLLEMRISTGEVKRVEEHHLRSDSVPSATHRLEELYDARARAAHCALDRRDRDEPPVTLPAEYCDRVSGPRGRRGEQWPYPGFDPSDRFLASISLSKLHIWDLERGRTVCVAGASSERP
jgi:hypothetical protein